MIRWVDRSEWTRAGIWTAEISLISLPFISGFMQPLSVHGILSAVAWLSLTLTLQIT